MCEGTGRVLVANKTGMWWVWVGGVVIRLWYAGCASCSAAWCAERRPHTRAPDLQAEARMVSKQDGVQFAKTHGCLFVETSAKVGCGGARVKVELHCPWGELLFWFPVLEICGVPVWTAITAPCSHRGCTLRVLLTSGRDPGLGRTSARLTCMLRTRTQFHPPHTSPLAVIACWMPPHPLLRSQGNIAVEQAFEELVLKILDTPSLLAGTASTFGLKAKQQGQQAGGGCCG